MKTQFPFVSIITLFFCHSLLQAQQKSISNVYLIQQLGHYQGEETSVEQFFSTHAAQFKLAPGSEMHKERSAAGVNGMIHHSYRQYHQGIPVYGATYLLHEKNGTVSSANGYFRPQIDLNLQASISPEEALRRAQLDMKSDKYAWEVDFPNADFAYQKPQPTLCIVDPQFPKKSEKVVLAYQFELYSWEPHDKQLYFVDAHTGYIHQKIPLLHESGVPAKAQTKYYGEQNIIVDSVGPNEFYLRDETRGDGIRTFNYGLSLFTNNSTEWNLTNSNQDEVALDAHYCSEKFYDLLLANFQWLGLDNQGASMNTVVHAGNGFNLVNAFWNGTHASFYDGDCDHGPLTTLEIVGHEFAHGIIQHTSNLIYEEESGAINEHFADVMGKLLEYTEDQANFSWTVGKSFQYDTNQAPFRSLEDPASLDMPDFYKGSLWDDDADVHTNSSVGNHFFYLMSVGESGVNEVGDTYDIPAIGIEKAAAIIFYTNRHYLTENSDYWAYREASILAAAELFGSSSTEVDAVTEAWKAVGLSDSDPPSIDLAVNVDPSLRLAHTCLSDEYIDLVYTLSNLGSETYFPDDLDELLISIYGDNQADLILLMEDTLLVGESREYTISDEVYFNLSVDAFSELELKVIGDENYSNNYSYSYIRNSIYTDNEVALSTSGGEFNCINRNHEIGILIRNESCHEITSGTEMIFTLSDINGAVIWTELYTLPNAILSSDNYFFQQAIKIDNWLPDNYILSVNLAGDPNISNNLSEITFVQPKEITEEYLNDFSTESTLEEKMNVANFLYPTKLADYNGEKYFATSQPFTDPPQELCFLDEGNFTGDVEQANLITGLLNGCLDFSMEPQPMIAFDLVQFRSDSDPQPTERSSMVQVVWEGEESGRRIYYGQEEEEVVHHTIELPANFRGSYSFKFLNRSGGKTDPTASDFFTEDVNLLDNLHFFGSTVSTDNPSQPRLILYPNPVTNELNIEQSSTINKLQVVNTQGQLLLTHIAYDGHPVDLSNLTDGYYWLVSWKEDGEKLVTPFVKLTK